MSQKLIVPLAAAAAIAFAGTSAQAESWSDKIEMCAIAAEDEGLVDLSEYDAEFDGGTSRRMSLVMTPLRDGDIVEIECRIARGRVVSVDQRS